MQTFAVVVLALVACASAVPITFFAVEEDEGKTRLLECVTPSTNAKGDKLSYKCRVRSKTEVEVIETDNGISTLEITEEFNPVVARETHFESSDVVINSQSDDDDDDSKEKSKYEVVEALGKKNRGGCADDEVFVGELDICVPYAPHKVEHKTSSLSQQTEPEVINPEHTILQVGYKKLKCPPGEIEIKDLGICAPIDNCWPHPDCSHLNEKKPANVRV